MARDYWFAFGAQPSAAAGLAPTFITFINSSGATQAPPTISEPLAASGLYKVSYTPTQTISFVLDGATTGLAAGNRYIFGVFDPQDTMGVTLVAQGATLVGFGNTAVAIGLSNIALGTTNVAIGTTLTAIGTSLAFGLNGLGDTASSFGTAATDPGTVFGYLKRVVEFLEGDQTYTKATGNLTFYSRDGAVTLINKVVSDSVNQTTKT